MRVTGIVFSARRDGNGMGLMKHCMENFEARGFETEIINTGELDIKPCSHCDLECFKKMECPIIDDAKYVYEKCFETDIIIFSIPNYSGHLSSLYFAFTERIQGIIKDYRNYEDRYLKKVNFIIIGNLSAGGDMALHQALYDFANRDHFPEALLISSREYGTSSIRGELIKKQEVRERVNRYVDMIAGKYSNIKES